MAAFFLGGFGSQNGYPVTGFLWYIQRMKGKKAMTLDRVLSRFGLASRTVASEWIRTGRVKVNGRVVRNPDVWVRAQQDAIHLNGQRLRQARKVYL
ncbi:MAG: S4 domain-containing protein, partial [Acidobacteriota bacterium]